MKSPIINPIPAERFLAITIERIEPNEIKKYRNTIQSQLLYIISGSIFVSYKTIINRSFNAGETLFIPAGSNYVLEGATDARYMNYGCEIENFFCKHFSIEMLHSYIDSSYTYDFKALKPNKGITSYWELLLIYYERGILDMKMKQIKKDELFILYRLYYGNKELSEFFYPIINVDFKFNEFVCENYLSVRSINELAQKSKYSISGFIKHFEQCYNMHPKEWILHQKKALIFHDLYFSENSISEIAYEYSFSSPSQFGQFCKKTYGDPPSYLRRKGRGGAELIKQTL